jgi:hypothetical protein
VWVAGGGGVGWELGKYLHHAPATLMQCHPAKGGSLVADVRVGGYPTGVVVTQAGHQSHLLDIVQALMPCVWRVDFVAGVQSTWVVCVCRVLGALCVQQPAAAP